MGPAHTTAAAARHSTSPSYSTPPELIFKFQKILRVLLTIKVLACGCNIQPIELQSVMKTSCHKSVPIATPWGQVLALAYWTAGNSYINML